MKKPAIPVQVESQTAALRTKYDDWKSGFKRAFSKPSSFQRLAVCESTEGEHKDGVGNGNGFDVAPGQSPGLSSSFTTEDENKSWERNQSTATNESEATVTAESSIHSPAGDDDVISDGRTGIENPGNGMHVSAAASSENIPPYQESFSKLLIGLKQDCENILFPRKSTVWQEEEALLDIIGQLTKDAVVASKKIYNSKYHKSVKDTIQALKKILELSAKGENSYRKQVQQAIDEMIDRRVKVIESSFGRDWMDKSEEEILRTKAADDSDELTFVIAFGVAWQDYYFERKREKIRGLFDIIKDLQDYEKLLRGFLDSKVYCESEVRELELAEAEAWRIVTSASRSGTAFPLDLFPNVMEIVALILERSIKECRIKQKHFANQARCWAVKIYGDNMQFEMRNLQLTFNDNDLSKVHKIISNQVEENFFGVEGFEYTPSWHLQRTKLRSKMDWIFQKFVTKARVVFGYSKNPKTVFTAAHTELAVGSENLTEGPSTTVTTKGPLDSAGDTLFKSPETLVLNPVGDSAGIAHEIAGTVIATTLSPEPKPEYPNSTHLLTPNPITKLKRPKIPEKKPSLLSIFQSVLKASTSNKKADKTNPELPTEPNRNLPVEPNGNLPAEPNRNFPIYPTLTPNRFVKFAQDNNANHCQKPNPHHTQATNRNLNHDTHLCPHRNKILVQNLDLYSSREFPPNTEPQALPNTATHFFPPKSPFPKFPSAPVIGIYFDPSKVYIAYESATGTVEPLIDFTLCLNLHQGPQTPFIPKDTAYPTNVLNVYDFITRSNFESTIVSNTRKKYIYKGDEVTLWGEEVIAIFLCRLRLRIEKLCSRNVSSRMVVISLPSYVSSVCKQRLKSALLIAGFRKSLIVQATTAIGVSYVESNLLTQEDHYILVIYAQTNAVDVAVLRIQGSKFETVATTGDVSFQKNVSILEKLQPCITDALKSSGIRESQLKICKCYIPNDGSYRELSKRASQELQVMLPNTEVISAYDPQEFTRGLVSIARKRSFDGTGASDCFKQKLAHILEIRGHSGLQFSKQATTSTGVQIELPVAQLGTKANPSIIWSRYRNFWTEETQIFASKILQKTAPGSCVKITVNEEGILTVSLELKLDPGSVLVPEHFTWRNSSGRMPLDEQELRKMKARVSDIVAASSSNPNVFDVRPPPAKKRRINY